MRVHEFLLLFLSNLKNSHTNSISLNNFHFTIISFETDRSAFVTKITCHVVCVWHRQTQEFHMLLPKKAEEK